MAVMLQRRNSPRIPRSVGLMTLALLLMVSTVSLAQGRSAGVDTAASQLPAEPAITAHGRAPQLETNSIISAVLCFTIGFAACLLLVHYMLPSLVHSQCVEIVREYLDIVRPDSDIRVVVLDRAGHEPSQTPKRASDPVAPTNVETGYESAQHLRVDRPTAPAGPADTDSDDAPNSMLSQIYQQNLHLRDQLRKQSHSVKQ